MPRHEPKSASLRFHLCPCLNRRFGGVKAAAAPTGKLSLPCESVANSAQEQRVRLLSRLCLAVASPLAQVASLLARVCLAVGSRLPRVCLACLAFASLLARFSLALPCFWLALPDVWLAVPCSWLAVGSRLSRCCLLCVFFVCSLYVLCVFSGATASYSETHNNKLA